MLTPREKWYDANTPEVSIIILNFNKSDLTKECLEALWANTFGYRYEIAIVDNGSTRTRCGRSSTRKPSFD